jgi:peptidyl-prolyl cis-trans isomerase D
MFRFFRKNREKVKRYLLIFFLSIVSIGMVITLAPIPGDVNQMQANVLATINGDNITTQDLQRIIQSRLRGSMGTDPHLVSGIANSVLDQMVLSRAVETQARRLGLQVGDQEVLQSLQAIPWLYNEGKFIGVDAYQNQIAQETGMSAAQFEAQLKQRMLFEKVRNVVTDGVEVTPAEVHEEFLRRNARAKVEYAVLDPSQFIKDVKVTPDALDAFFKKDPARYTVPQQRRVRYVIIDPDRIRASAKLDDSELKAYYNSHLSDYRVPDRVKVAHILFKKTGKRPAEVAAIEKKARDVLKQIKSGGNFAELAKKNSEDSSAQNGGEIGWIVRGQTVKEFEDSAFSMNRGQVSDLIKTIYGFHIVKVEDKQTAHLQTFDEVKDQIRASLEKQKLAQAQEALADRMVEELKATPNDFDGAARKLGLQPQQTPLFRYNQPVPDLGKSDSFENLAFQLREGEVGKPISVPKGTAVLQVAQVVPEHVPSLNEVRAQVEQDYKAEQSRLIAAQKARELSSKAKSGGDFKRLAQSEGLTVKQSKDFTQQENVDETIPGSAFASAFTLNPGQTSDVINGGGNQAVFRVISRTRANESDFAAQQSQIAEELLERKRSIAFELYEDNLKQELIRNGTLKLNDKGMKAFLASYSRGGA